MEMWIVYVYFIILGVLSIYGAHRYYLLYLYKKNYHSDPKPKNYFKSLPVVTIQLPIYNEEYVVERLIKSVINIDYPKDKLEIQVLDDSTDDTSKKAKALVEHYKKLGYDIHYIHRKNRKGFKAGALDNGLKIAKGEYIAVFDADFIPPKDFLKKTIHYFTNPQIALVQARWGYINRDYSLLTNIQAILLDGHFIIEHTVRNRSDMFFNFNGTGGIWRKKAIFDGGGWEHDTLTEDLDLSYRVQMKGWKFIYLQDLVVPSELPVDITAFKNQQHRWAKGAIQTGKKLYKKILKSDVPLKVKIEAFFHLWANLAYLLMIPLSIAIFPTVVIRRDLGLAKLIIIDIPFILMATFSFSTFYLFSQKAVYKKWSDKIKFLPFISALGIGLSVNNSFAVLEALLGKKTEFVRTPKYGVKTKNENWKKKKYRGRNGIIPFIELFLAIYFFAVIIVSFIKGIYVTIPFLLLFFFGYSYTSLLSFSSIFNLKSLFTLKKRDFELIEN